MVESEQNWKWGAVKMTLDDGLLGRASSTLPGQVLDVGNWKVCMARPAAAVGALPRRCGIWTSHEVTIPRDRNVFINSGYVVWFDTAARATTRPVALMRKDIAKSWGAELESAREYEVTVKFWPPGKHNEHWRCLSGYVPPKMQRRRREDEETVSSLGFDKIIMAGYVNWRPRPVMIKGKFIKADVGSARCLDFKEFEERWAWRDNHLG